MTMKIAVQPCARITKARDLIGGLTRPRTWYSEAMKCNVAGAVSLKHSPGCLLRLLCCLNFTSTLLVINTASCHLIILFDCAMMVQLSMLAFAASILSSQSLVLAISASDIPSDTPVSSLLSSANAHLAKGETNDALTYYDVAISRDPNNYLTLFKRGATYLSLGRTHQAISDFDKVLEIKPDFEGALLQRARIESKNGDWKAAKKDYLSAGKSAGTELTEMEEAEGAAKLAHLAEEKGDYEECVTQAGSAIMVASKNASLRKLRVRCRFERGEVQEGISDLAHVLQLQPGLTDPHLQISSILFFALKDTERGVAQIRKCLHSDPDSKSCKKLHRREKQIDKQLQKIKKLLEKKSWSSAAKLLVGSGEDVGLIQEIQDEVKELREAGTIPATAPNDLLADVIEMTCEAYSEVYIS
jgi:DnaJ family protein C protein 3